ncbi:MAG: ERF family protein [Candidatus Binataceae bacterium]
MNRAKEWHPIHAAEEAEVRTLIGRPVSEVDSEEGIYVDEDGNVFKLAEKERSKPMEVEQSALEAEAAGADDQASDNNRALKEGKAGGAASEDHGDKAEGRITKRNAKRRSSRARSANSLGAHIDHSTAREDSGSAAPMFAQLNLREKFAEVRRRLGYIQKRGHNERHNYNYVTAADLAGSVGDILAELGVVVIPQLQSISTETPRSSSDRIARVVMNYRFVDASSGEELSVRVAGEGADAGDKAPYKAMTGALKYALLQSFLLATGDDPEDEHANSRAVLGSERVITPEQVRELQGLIEETGTELERVLAYYRVAALSEMSEGSYRRALEVLNRKATKQSQENGTHAQN